MAILSVMLIALTDIFSSIVGVRLESESSSAVEQDGSFILSRLYYDISRAQSVSLPANMGDTSATLDIVINGIDYIYTINNGNLELTNTNGTDVLNSINTTISNFTVQKIGNAGGTYTIRFSYTVTGKTVPHSGPRVKTYQSTAGLR